MQLYPTALALISKDAPCKANLQKQVDSAANTAQRDGIATMLNVVDYVSDKEEKSYVVSDSLLDALKTVECDEVGPWHLQGIRAYHFIVNKKQVFDDVNKYSEMFVTIIPPQEQLFRHKNLDVDHYKIQVVLMGLNAGEQWANVYMGARYKEGATFQEIIDSAKDNLGGAGVSTDFKMEYLRLALNLILYVNSPDPEIMRLKPQVYNTKHFRENYFKKCKDERDLLGIFSLGWDFHGREYAVDIGTRKGHFKWQPCGKLWSERKLIYVQQTTVNYNKG